MLVWVCLLVVVFANLLVRVVGFCWLLAYLLLSWSVCLCLCGWLDVMRCLICRCLVIFFVVWLGFAVPVNFWLGCCWF